MYLLLSEESIQNVVLVVRGRALYVEVSMIETDWYVRFHVLDTSKKYVSVFEIEYN